MPRGDGTGPLGYGRMSGRGMGYCAGFGAPGYMFAYPGGGRMMRRGFGAVTGTQRFRGASSQMSALDEEAFFDRRVSELEARIDELTDAIRQLKETKQP